LNIACVVVFVVVFVTISFCCVTGGSSTLVICRFDTHHTIIINIVITRFWGEDVFFVRKHKFLSRIFRQSDAHTPHRSEWFWSHYYTA
jgi:hypothetical protein